MTNLLITGGTGYIGSCVAVELAKLGYGIIILDNLSNSSKDVLVSMEKLLGYRPKFYETDLRDKAYVDQIFKENDISGVLHFAGLKAVGESCLYPSKYLDNNVSGSNVLLDIMSQYNVKNIVFSSSATVYDSNNDLPYKENDKLGTTNPYGTSKLLIEKILEDMANFGGMNVLALRYFNPIGAHSSGLLGESPKGKPNNLFPYIMKVITSELEKLSVYGDDYNTKDGTGMRDYIDIMDLANGHIQAYKYLESLDTDGNFEAINLGVGRAISVLEMIDMVEDVTGQKINYKITDRRAGDIAKCFADNTKAKDLLGWTPKRNIKQAIETGYKFYTKNN